MRTIQQLWQGFKDGTMPKDAGPIQIQEERRAFYAGALAILTSVAALGDDDISEDQACKIMEDFEQELKDFTAKLGTET